MATYYIDPGGDDGDAGSEASPRQTIQGGIALMSTTDTLIFNDGSYNGESQWRTPNVMPNGNSSTYTKFQALNDYQAIIRAPVGGSYGIWLPDNREYIWLHGLLVQGGTSSESRSGNSGFNGNANAGTFSAFSEHLKFTNFKIKWFNKTGLFAGCNNSLFSNFEIFECGSDVQSTSVTPHDHGAYISDYSHHNIYEHCSFYGNSGAGIQIYSSSKNPNNHIVRYFTSYNNGINAPGVWLLGSDNTIAYGVCYGNRRGVHSFSGARASVLNMVCHDNDVEGLLFTSSMTNGVIKNSIFLGNAGSQLSDSGTGTTKSNNLTSGTTPAAIWTDPANRDYSLKNTAGTPAADVTTYIIDQGVGVGFTSDGTSDVPQGIGVDIGHLEWASDPPDAPAISHATVYEVTHEFTDITLTVIKGTNNVVHATVSTTGKASLSAVPTDVTVTRNT